MKLVKFLKKFIRGRYLPNTSKSFLNENPTQTVSLWLKISCNTLSSVVLLCSATKSIK
jgi:hypothetical protein